MAGWYAEGLIDNKVIGGSAGAAFLVHGDMVAYTSAMSADATALLWPTPFPRKDKASPNYINDERSLNMNMPNDKITITTKNKNAVLSAK